MKPLTDKLTVTTSPDAEFIRLPKPGTRCQTSGLARTTLVELIESRAIRAKHLRKPGALRGIVLIDRESLVNYLRHLPDATASEAALAPTSEQQ